MLQWSEIASETSYYKKVENEQLQDNVKSNKNLENNFLGGQFSWAFFWTPLKSGSKKIFKVRNKLTRALLDETFEDILLN